MEEGNWRDDPGLKSKIVYKENFAIFPVVCKCGTRVWLKRYYSKYVYWYHKSIDDNMIENYKYELHEDFIENITEEDFVIVRLIEGI